MYVWMNLKKKKVQEGRNPSCFLRHLLGWMGYVGPCFSYAIAFPADVSSSVSPCFCIHLRDGWWAPKRNLPHCFACCCKTLILGTFSTQYRRLCDMCSKKIEAIICIYSNNIAEILWALWSGIRRAEEYRELRSASLKICCRNYPDTAF